MENSSQILTEISNITRDIQENYPELQKYLDETRSTLPKSYSDDSMNQDLQDYLTGLKEMVKKYKEGH
ncbi:hypothetical protein [Psychroserpens mesophilus]|uniref:hypothetical protein n=1 Tax=Psychroserpens mesophilus TaxID=325473 RepID=UPI00058BDAFC|nr:hypothetical protein [Psychroserpens mesophilus]